MTIQNVSVYVIFLSPTDRPRNMQRELKMTTPLLVLTLFVFIYNCKELPDIGQACRQPLSYHSMIDNSICFVCF